MKSKTNLKPLIKIIKKELDKGFYYNAREGLRKLIIINNYETLNSGR